MEEKRYFTITDKEERILSQIDLSPLSTQSIHIPRNALLGMLGCFSEAGFDTANIRLQMLTEKETEERLDETSRLQILDKQQKSRRELADKKREIKERRLRHG